MLIALVSITFAVVLFFIVLLRWRGAAGYGFLLGASIVFLIGVLWLSFDSDGKHFLKEYYLYIDSFMLLVIIAIFWLSYPHRVQSELKVKLAKFFSLYQYDYRESWLGFNRALDEANVQGDFYQLSIKALADITNSQAGRLWSKRGERFSFTDHWNSPLSRQSSFQMPVSLIEFIDRTNWVVDIVEYEKSPKIYKRLKLDLKRNLFRDHKIFIPIRRGEELIGIVGLAESAARFTLNWELHDLLKAAGQQLASYLALYEATTHIYEEQQFAAFNRLSTFVVHDLKNVTAQLELINHNSSKHGENKEFIEDSFDTVKSAAKRLNKMLVQLRRKQLPKQEIQSAYLPKVYEIFLEKELPFELEKPPAKVFVQADAEQLLTILQHLQQNAMDASEKGQKIVHKIELVDSEIHWHIIDKGKGMAVDFIRQQLFKPFSTTKGNTGMGIGVYQCRYLLQSFGGDLVIQSEIDKGTDCIIILQTIKGEHNADI